MEQKEMNELEKVEQLVDKSGCTYAEAKEALEKSEWNLLDAIILLEQEGKAAKSSATYASTEPRQQAKNGSYEEPEVLRGEEAERIRPEEFKDARADGYGRGNFGEDARHYSQKAAGSAKGFFARAKAALTQNYMTVYGRSGNQVLHLPVWVLLLLLLVWFWGVIVGAVILMLFGCRFHFEGRDFGKTNVNDTFDRMSDYTYNAGQKVKQEFSSGEKPKDANDNFYDPDR